jgi:hypothetical protein
MPEFRLSLREISIMAIVSVLFYMRLGGQQEGSWHKIAPI